MSNLNPQQQRAVGHKDGPLLVLAGAGTGKTRVLVHRIAQLVSGGASPKRILAVTFTNKAASEMRHRLENEIGLYAASEMWIGTFHGTCARLLRKFGHHIGIESQFSIFDSDDQKRLVSQILKKIDPNSIVTARGLLSAFERSRNRGISPLDDEWVEPLASLVEQAYPLYRQQVRKEKAIDFSGLLEYACELVSVSSCSDEVKSLFDFVLVDEFQDTNLVQYQLVSHIVEKTRNLMVVGDDDQSIYGWRGAEPRNILDFAKEYPDAEVVTVEQNYRSTGVILEAANGVIRGNRNRHKKSLWTENPRGHLLEIYGGVSEKQEAELIAQYILTLESERAHTRGDVAILYRTHAQSRVLEEVLRRSNIGYIIVGGISFFQRKEIKDILAYLRLALHPQADSSLLRIVNTPARGIGKTTITRLVAYAQSQGLSLLEAVRTCSLGAVSSIKTAARRRLATFVEVIDGLRTMLMEGAPVSELVIQAATRTGYMAALDVDDSPESKDRRGNLAELVSMASDYDAETEGTGSFVAFDERIALTASSDAPDGLGEVVTLMTVHAAKGLEFPVVFMCGMEDGLFPSVRERADTDNEAALEEERRLAYVAMTRAKQRLILTYAHRRRSWQEIRMNEPSRFFDDIPEACFGKRDFLYSGNASKRSAKNISVEYGQESPDINYNQDYNYDQSHYGKRRLSSGSRVAASRSKETNVSISVGDMVAHTSFGMGSVLEAKGEADDRKLLVNFGSVGLKTVLARFVTKQFE